MSDVVGGKDVLPPLGIRPRFIVDEQRAREIVQGMDRFIAAGVPVPREWSTELSELHDRIRQHAVSSTQRPENEQDSAMRVKFIGRPSLGYQPGRVYMLTVETDRAGRPIIRRPYPCPYGSWDAFWVNWQKVREVEA